MRAEGRITVNIFFCPLNSALLFTAMESTTNQIDRIDRTALVHRHHPINKSLDVWSPLTVGNGEFAFTADVTGLQTFAEQYEKGICLCMMSQWA
jgi:hypothetical protein